MWIKVFAALSFLWIQRLTFRIILTCDAWVVIVIESRVTMTDFLMRNSYCVGETVVRFSFSLRWIEGLEIINILSSCFKVIVVFVWAGGFRNVGNVMFMIGLQLQCWLLHCNSRESWRFPHLLVIHSAVERLKAVLCLKTTSHALNIAQSYVKSIIWTYKEDGHL